MIKAGLVLNGRYKLLKPLGQGSQAFVWVAEHLALGSQVAVKLIDPELAKQDDARERFAREATAAAKLRSAHVVHILDHGIEGEQPFIVMELLEGEDLFDRLERRKRLTLAETSKIVTQVARALMRAHAEGIIHRDLKPENVFLVRNEDDELAKVLDFGVAKVTTSAKAVMVRTGVGTLIGTPHYMSPEQVKGLTEIDHRSDLWSLAVITYQCVTGQLPFDSEGVGDLLIRITMSKPPVPSTLNTELPPQFDDWFKKASAKDPDERFETAREMADALAKAVGAPQAPVSQPGRVLVNLADSPDLDWGSLAGVRIPIPPRKSAPPAAPDEKENGAASAKSGAEEAGSTRKASARLPTLPEADDAIDVVEGLKSMPPSAPPPPSTEELGDDDLDWSAPADEAAAAKPPPPPPAKRATPAPPPAAAARTVPAADVSPPPSSRRATPPSAPTSDNFSGSPTANNPFLAQAPPPSSRGRHLQTTVTGLASTSQPDALEATEEDVEPSRRRRATWFVAVGLVVAAVGITVGVIKSRGGFGDLTGNATTAHPSAPAETSRALQTAPPVVATSTPSTSSSAETYDPMVTKKQLPSSKPSAGPAPPFRTKPSSDEIIIELPTEEREVPLPPHRQ